MIHWILAMNAQGLTRLDKWYTPHSQNERNRIKREMTATVLKRPRHMCNFLTWREFTIVYRRYASLYFIFCIDNCDNELITLEIMHLLVRALDRYFENVCELDLIFDFARCYAIVDELFMNGEQQESVVSEITRGAAGAEMDELTRALDEANLI